MGYSHEILPQIIQRNLAGSPNGIYAVCTSHSLVIEAAVDQVMADGGLLLIEATANQVNQFGGYSGMVPGQFREYVLAIAARQGLASDRVVLAGDHLGPVCWQDEPAEAAMQKACELVAQYAAAGFNKIHLDCSMPLLGDPAVLDDDIVAARAARLCAVAEQASAERASGGQICYVIGTEVPPPGGADHAIQGVEVTPPLRVERTLAIHKEAFAAHGVASAWLRVLAIVVQPGVEFDHTSVIHYCPEQAQPLRQLAETWADSIAFEAHSTDYQTPEAFAGLVRDHFAILKVGPAVTFALREALFALSYIEDEIVPIEKRSRLRDICEEVMIAEPGDWARFYQGTEDELRILRRYSLSDRIRYYWPKPSIAEATERLFANLESIELPVGLVNQFLPGLALAIAQRGGGGVQSISLPRLLVKLHIRSVLEPYAAACSQEGAK